MKPRLANPLVPRATPNPRALLVERVGQLSIASRAAGGAGWTPWYQAKIDALLGTAERQVERFDADEAARAAGVQS